MNFPSLVHELFHLVLGNEVTFPGISGVYSVSATTMNPIQITGLEYVYANVNPES